MHSGRPGTGKTYNLTKDVIRILNKGVKVRANYWIDWNGYEEKRTWWKKMMMRIGWKKEWREYPKENLGRWKKLDDLYDFEDGIIAMDEAHVYMNARRWKDLPEDMEKKLAQHRKDGLHIWGTVQSVNRLDTIIRELVDYWYVYENGLFWFTRWEFNIDEDKNKKFPMSKKWIMKKKSVYEAYDTLEKIEVGK